MSNSSKWMSRRLPMTVLLFSLFLAMGSLASAAVPCPVGVNATTNAVRTAASPLTFEYSSNTGSDRLLVVTIGIGSTSNPGTAGTVSAVTYAGQAMTQAGTAFSTDGARVYIFTLSEYEGMPTSGTVSISYSSGSIVEAGATSFYNVNQATPLGAFGSSSSSSNITAISVGAASAVGDTVIAVAATDEGPSNQSITTSAAGGQAQLWNYSGNNYLSAAASTKPGADGTVTSSFTAGQGSDYAAGAISIKPAVAPAPVVTITGGNTLDAECGAPLVLPGATALDGCGAGIAAAVSDLDGLNEANPAVGVYDVVYSATDGAGTTGTETLVVTVSDTTDPVVVITGGNTLDAECGVPFLLPDAEATDACDGVLAASVSDLDGLDVNNPSKGVYSVVYGATDLEGNTGTETLTVTVNDTADPLVVITGGDSLTSQCGSAITLPGASAFDGCDGALGISISVPLGLNLTNPALGNYNVTYNATDGEGYTGSAILAVTVSDTVAPEITQCANDQAVSVDALCEALVPDFTGGVIAVDNCDPSPVITQDPAAGTAAGLGNTVVTITAMDAEGNSDTCQATLTVEDNTAPEITVCATGQNELADENCEALVPDFTGAVVAADNCDASPVITQDPAAGTVVGLGVTAVTITVTDAAGNAETCVANFTVNEDVPPTGTILINNNLSVTNSPDVTLNLTWDDGECASGVVRMRFSDDGRTWSVWEPLLASKPYTLPGPDGYNTVRVQYRDRANNVSERYNDFIRLDTVAPTGTILINNNAWRTFNRNVVLNLTWDDTDGSGVVRMRFSQDGKTWTAWEPLSATKAITLTGPIGYNTVRVQYRDAAGNNSDRFNDYILLAE